MSDADRIARLDLDLDSLPPLSHEVDHEVKVAIFDLTEENSFRLIPRTEGPPPPAGPYAVRLGLQDRKLLFDIATETGEPAIKLVLSLSPLRKIIKDYFLVCESYFEAVKTRTPAEIEAIDMGRRGLHNEGAEILAARLEGKALIDDNTARRLFTLVAALHYRA